MIRIFSPRYNFLSVIASSVALVAGLAGCQPRGETHTLQQILDDSRAEYRAVGEGASKDAKPTLEKIVADLEALVKVSGERGANPQVATISSRVGESLNGVVPRAGFTARAGLAELISQYRALSEDASAASQPLNAGRVKLLVARTYSALASELQSTRFKIAV